MKCPYCGGEISFQSAVCPYCGSKNAQGSAFQEELRKKIERNKLLKPFLIKQKTPELVQKMLTRIILIVTAANFLLLLISFGIFLWKDRPNTGKVNEGSHAESFQKLYYDSNDYSCADFFTYANAFIDRRENKEAADGREWEWLLKSAYYLMRDSAEYEPQRQEEIRLYIRTFFEGYIGLEEEELAFLQPDESGEYAYWPDAALLQDAVNAMEKKLEVTP